MIDRLVEEPANTKSQGDDEAKHSDPRRDSQLRAWHDTDEYQYEKHADELGSEAHREHEKYDECEDDMAWAYVHKFIIS